MTRNEKIAEVMGWSYYKKDNIFFQGDHWLHSNSWEFCKLLQAKMVADGWMVEINIYPEDDGGGVSCYAHKGDEYIRVFNSVGVLICFDTEPAALHALFCKVNGITDEN